MKFERAPQTSPSGRRLFLTQVACGLAASSVSTFSVACGSSNADSPTPLPEPIDPNSCAVEQAGYAAAYAKVPEAFREIARTHLDAVAPADPSTEAALATELLAPMRDAQQAVRTIEAAVTKDFVEGNTTSVAGWIVSNTELSVAVLIERSCPEEMV